MTITTSRFQLPLIAAGQAQKEVTHNEALALIDAVVSPVVQAVGAVTPPASPTLGQCWIVGAAPTGVWAGQPNALACWTAGGWRFVSATTGFEVWSIADGMMARFNGSTWVIGNSNAAAYRVQGLQVVGAQRPAISGPAGGAVVDQEVRIAVNAILSALRVHGLIAT